MDAAWAVLVHEARPSPTDTVPFLQLGCMSVAVLSSARAQCEFMDHLGGDLD